MAVVNGTSGNDSLLGTNNDDVISGFGGADTLNGRAGNDSLIGGDGNDRLIGGDGGDTMTGGTGDDLYFVDNGSDVVVEAENEGIDLVRSTVSYQLSAWVNDLTLAGSNALSGYGNDIENRITGNSMDNYLWGGTGPDTLIGRGGDDTLDGYSHSFGGTDPDIDVLDGGAGNDFFIVDNAGDVLIDSGGLDHVFAYNIDWTLAAGFENLSLNNGQTEATVHGVGNSADNVIDAEQGWHVVLNGAGGNDSLFGSPQDDTLAGGNGDDFLNGGWDFDRLNGGAGDDTLLGGGDFHTDTMTGGAGRDQFRFWAPDAGPERITDFLMDIDQLAFDDSSFTAIGATGDFVFQDPRFYAAAGATTAHDASDRVIYNTSTGQLYYDADGAGGADASFIATLSGAPQLKASDITVI